MAGITLAQAQTNLDKWIATSESVAGGKSITRDGHSWTQADAAEIQNMINFWSGKVAQLSHSVATRRGIRYGVPL